MPVFTPQKAITTDIPTIEVAVGLKPGRYRFQLVVVDDEGNASAPSELDVEIVAPVVTPPVLDPPVVLRPPIDLSPIPVRPPIFRPPFPVVRPPNPTPNPPVQ
jgi:hypothetical protein